MKKTDTEWKKQLSKEEYRILRQKGTEAPFSGKYWNTFTRGTYVCAACKTPLFSSENKYDAGCGWPSYDKPISEEALINQTDTSHGMTRTEVLCKNCGGHLGHVFPDGPPETTGDRYCINSAALNLKKTDADVSQNPEPVHPEL